MDALNGAPKMSDDHEPDIIIVGLAKKAFYLLKGDDHLDQLLLADGDFPKPVHCLHFNSLFEAKQKLGDAFIVVNCWSIHPEIFQRLSNSNCLVETDAYSRRNTVKDSVDGENY